MNCPECSNAMIEEENKAICTTCGVMVPMVDPDNEAQWIHEQLLIRGIGFVKPDDIKEIIAMQTEYLYEIGVYIPVEGEVEEE